jgi:hypothetical protein
MKQFAITAAWICLVIGPAAYADSASLAAPGDCAQPVRDLDTGPLQALPPGSSDGVAGPASAHFVPIPVVGDVLSLNPLDLTRATGATVDAAGTTVDGAVETVGATIDATGGALEQSSQQVGQIVPQVDPTIQQIDLTSQQIEQQIDLTTEQAPQLVPDPSPIVDPLLDKVKLP